ncbi:MAG: chemotaxis protein CheC [Anaerolineaceae bacterium]|nr:chemotaxis protein CheC [Anaerolineaceae bacterium]
MGNYYSSINAEQKDAVGEIINIGFGRAASSLSILIGSPIILRTPEVEVYSIPELISVLEEHIPDQAVIIHQVFSGTINGDVLLFMNINSASVLVDLLSGGNGVSKQLTPSDREALIEVGNILMNGYIGSFGNLLKLSLNFDLPHLREESLTEWLGKLNPPDAEPQYSVLVRTEFHIANVKAGGYVALLMDLVSLKTLIETVERGIPE